MGQYLRFHARRLAFSYDTVNPAFLKVLTYISVVPNTSPLSMGKQSLKRAKC